MNREEELKRLRDQMMADVVPLVMQSEDIDSRFAILLRIVQTGNADANVYQQAYETAKKIKDQSERLDAIMALVDEIDFEVGVSANDQESQTSSDLPQTDQTGDSSVFVDSAKPIIVN